MRLSESLRKNIMEATINGVLNKFKGKSRRDILFFEDILADYVKECEDAGYKKEMKLISQKWASMVQQVIPKTLRKLSPLFLLNVIMKKAWTNIGILDDLHITKENNIIKITTKNEALTRIVGKNEFSVGSYTGILNALYNSQLECIDVIQTKETSRYTFKFKNKSFKMKTKDKDLYNSLNYLIPNKGFTLKDALEKNIFQLKENNRIYFRGKGIGPVENTIFHLISNQNMLLKKVPDISYKYFSEIIEKDSSNDRKLALLKVLLQVMGWGTIKIIIKSENEVLFKIHNQPYGLQLEKDNWDFLIKTILGYLWILDKKFKITDVKYSHRRLKILYSK